MPVDSEVYLMSGYVDAAEEEGEEGIGEGWGRETEGFQGGDGEVGD